MSYTKNQDDDEDVSMKLRARFHGFSLALVAHAYVAHMYRAYNAVLQVYTFVVRGKTSSRARRNLPQITLMTVFTEPTRTNAALVLNATVRAHSLFWSSWLAVSVRWPETRRSGAVRARSFALANLACRALAAHDAAQNTLARARASATKSARV